MFIYIPEVHLYPGTTFHTLRQYTGCCLKTQFIKCKELKFLNVKNNKVPSFTNFVLSLAFHFLNITGPC